MRGLLHQQIQHLGQFYWLERKQLLHTSHPHQTTAERRKEFVKQRARSSKPQLYTKMSRSIIIIFPLTFDVMLDMEMLIKFAPASVATAFASIVLPVPGGPNNRMPLHGFTYNNS